MRHSAYFLKFIENYPRTTLVYFLKFKSEVEEWVREFVAYVERRTGEKVKRLCSDNGKEYGSRTLVEYIRHQETIFEKKRAIQTSIE